MRGTGILLDDNFDLQVQILRDANGKIMQGLVIGETLLQNQAMILISHPGEIKEAPWMGCGIEDLLMDNDYLLWRQKIRSQMELDQQKVQSVQFAKNLKLQIDASY